MEVRASGMRESIVYACLCYRGCVLKCFVCVVCCVNRCAVNDDGEEENKGC